MYVILFLYFIILYWEQMREDYITSLQEGDPYHFKVRDELDSLYDEIENNETEQQQPLQDEWTQNDE